MSITLCIPSVNKTINKNFIYRNFEKYNFGRIKNIIILPNSFNSNTVFISYYFWFYNQQNNELKKKLNNKECFKIIYDFPWFWKCYEANKKIQ